jgi:hypothetical protein
MRPITSAGRRSPLGPLGIVEHPINQVLKFGLSPSAFAHEAVNWNFALDPLSLRVGLVPDMQSAVALLN